MTHVFQTDANENAKKTEFHLQDYNRSVLELITMPNIIMAWCECRE
jgi:protein-histidine N-methyltransferase